MTKVLLTDGMGPYELGWGQDMFDLMGARLTRGQGPFTLKSHLHAWGLYTIAENIPVPATVLERPNEEILRKELKKGYDYVGIQIKALHVSRIAKMVEIIKEVSPKSKIVIGGYGVRTVEEGMPHDPNKYAEYILANADYRCYEEGAGFFRKILGADTNQPVTQNYQPLCGLTLKGLDNIINFPLSSVLVALGCPNACEFCNTSAFFKGKKITVSSPEVTVEALKNASARMEDGIALFNVIWDEDYLLDKNYVMRVGELLQKENLIGKINFFCFGSIKGVSQYTPEELALSGVGAIWIGVESKFDECFTGEHNFQKRAGRDVAEVFADLHKYGIMVIGSNILGLDFHNRENLEEDIDYFVSLKPDLYQISPLTPCPGTALYGRMKEENRIFDTFTWEHLHLWKDDIFQYKNFKKNEIKNFFDSAHKKLYETNGPTVLSAMDVMLQGYRTLVHSKNPQLQERAERFLYFARKIGGVLYAIKKMAPSEEVLKRAEDVEKRYVKYIKEISFGQKIAQSLIGRIVETVYKKELKRASAKMPEPPWRITQYYGDKSAPKVTAREDRIKHFLQKKSHAVIKKFLNMEFKPQYQIRLKDIDDFDVNFNTIEIEGDLMNYVDEGKGEVILMLHGNPTWSYLYRDFIKELKKDYRCIALDHLGYGLSDKPPRADYSMEAHIRRLGKFVEALDLKNITLVCQDWGGIIGLSYASKNKERFNRLIPMNTTGFLPETFGELTKCLKAWAFPYLWSFKIPIIGKKMAMDWNLFLKLGMKLGIHNRKRQLHKKAMLGYLYPFQRVNDRIAIMKSVRQVPMVPWSPIRKLLEKTGNALKGWNVRTQVIWGTKDPVFVSWFADKFEEILPNHAPTLKIPTASHFLQDDEPQIIIKKIKEFLAEEVSQKTRKKVTA